MFSAYCLFHCGVILLLFWFPALLISCSGPPVNVNSWWLWMQLPCLLSQGWSLFLSINKLLLPLCACLCVSMVYLHVISFGNTVGCHCMLCFEFGLFVFLKALFITPCCQGSFTVAGSVISCWCCVWLLWQDSKWVEEKQYLLRTNQELHEKVHWISLFSL